MSLTEDTQGHTWVGPKACFIHPSFQTPSRIPRESPQVNMCSAVKTDWLPGITEKPFPVTPSPRMESNYSSSSIQPLVIPWASSLHGFQSWTAILASACFDSNQCVICRPRYLLLQSLLSITSFSITSCNPLPYAIAESLVVTEWEGTLRNQPSCRGKTYSQKIPHKRLSKISWKTYNEGDFCHPSR